MAPSVVRGVLDWFVAKRWQLLGAALLGVVIVLSMIAGAWVNGVWTHLKNDHDNFHVLVQDYVQRHAGGR